MQLCEGPWTIRQQEGKLASTIEIMLNGVSLSQIRANLSVSMSICRPLIRGHKYRWDTQGLGCNRRKMETDCVHNLCGDQLVAHWPLVGVLVSQTTNPDA